MTNASILAPLIGLGLSPLLVGIINRTKAVFAGRHGQPLLQAYSDLAKLLRKGAVYSRSTSWVLRLAPAVGMACAVVALLLLPHGSIPALVAFPGDILLLVYLLGLLRFALVMGALDTASSFEGMGASREMLYATLAEPALFLALAAAARLGGSFSLTTLYAAIEPSGWSLMAPALCLAALALFVVFLAENARIPFDDPNTHLELTMIHEVMILDYSGPDLAVLLYTSYLKLWIIGTLIVSLAIGPAGLPPTAALAAHVGGLVAVAVLTGVVESVMARLSLLRVPQLLVGAGAIAALAFVLVVRFGP